MNKPRTELTDQERHLLELSGDLHKKAEFDKLEYAFGGNRAIASNYSTLFCQFEQQGENLLVQLFPRAGAEDSYFEGEYLRRCAKCNTEVPNARNGVYPPCPNARCKSRRLKYVPGRLEQKVDGLSFPDTMGDTIKAACHRVWAGDVTGPELVPELGAWVLRFKMVGSGPEVLANLLDKFLEHIDHALDN